MRIALPQIQHGGAATWIKLFKKFLVQKGYQTTHNIEGHYQVLLSMADLIPVAKVKELRRRGKKCLYRMDGPFWQYLSNPKVSAQRNRILRSLILSSDKVVFQSNFVQKVCQELLNLKINSTVIYNAADPGLFLPEGKKLAKPADKKVILAGGNWGPPGLAVPMLHNIARIAQKLADEPLEFWVFGKFPPEVLSEVAPHSQQPNLDFKHLKLISRADMPKFLRTADLLLYPRPNDPCPNLIIEALHCGTPIVGLRSGSLPELLGDSCLLGECENTIRHVPAIDIDDISEKVIQTLDNLPKYRSKVLVRSRHFTLENMGNRYLSQIKKLF